MRTDVVGTSYMREWAQEEFSNILRFFVQDWLKLKGRDLSWYVSPDQVPTWMTDSNGEILVLERSEWAGRNRDDQ